MRRRQRRRNPANGLPRTPARWVRSPEWHKPSPTMVEQFWRETEANGGLDLSQCHATATPPSPGTGSVTAAIAGGRRRTPGWTFHCGYRRPPSRNMPRWKNFGGTRAACRQCVLDDYGATYEKCGHIDPDLNHVDKPRQVYDGWCRSCGSNAGPQLGEAFHADHAPSTSGAEETLRALLRVRLPIATSRKRTQSGSGRPLGVPSTSSQTCSSPRRVSPSSTTPQDDGQRRTRTTPQTQTRTKHSATSAGKSSAYALEVSPPRAVGT